MRISLVLALGAALHPAFAADRPVTGPLGPAPVVALPGSSAAPALPGASALPSIPALPSAAPAAQVNPAVPGVQPAVAAASAKPGVPASAAAAPAQRATVAGALPQLSAASQRGGVVGADASGALNAAFDGAKTQHACGASCSHADDDHGDDFPTDASGNPFIVPGHLDPLLPSRQNPQTWTARITLHLHSIFSDGTMTPEAVMDLAYQQGVREVALSDHDTAAGLLRAWKRAKELGMTFHPSVELTARGGVHVGAVDVDITNPKLVALLERVRIMRHAKASGIVDNLNALPELSSKGIRLTIDEVKAKSQHDAGGTIELPHVARVLLDHGLIKSVDEAFDTFLKGDVLQVPGVEQDPTVDEVLDAVRAAGGKAFINHPYTVRGADDAEKDRNLLEILDKGVDGLEVYRPSHATSPDGKRRVDARAAKYLTLIDERGLLAGNGADFHGTDTHLDNLVVWMPKVLASQLTAGLKDANARAIAALERLDGAAAAPKTFVPPVRGLMLLPLAQLASEQQAPWDGIPASGWVMMASIIAFLVAATQARELDKKHPRLSDFFLFATAMAFFVSFFAMLFAKAHGL